ncbi:MAG: hypothetical protein EBR30_16520 [Cytophagia bacterium]|nr:hypothetical protein [Cytophagia bacterium]NBW36589.1 hypothetical protein [Cytophagia bacterium]
MMVKEKIPQIHKNFTLFSNLELHFIITVLLEASLPPEKLVSKGSLYIKSSPNSTDDELTFFYIGKPVASPHHQQNTNSLVFIGKLCPAFNNIQLHTFCFSEAEQQVGIDIPTIKELIKAFAETIDCNRGPLLAVVLKIIDQQHFTDRKQNPLFTLPDTRHNPYAQYFDLGIVNNANYSGIYYCVAERTKSHQKPLITIYQYEVEEMISEGLATKYVVRKDQSYENADGTLAIPGK